MDVGKILRRSPSDSVASKLLRPLSGSIHPFPTFMQSFVIALDDGNWWCQLLRSLEYGEWVVPQNNTDRTKEPREGTPGGTEVCIIRTRSIGKIAPRWTNYDIMSLFLQIWRRWASETRSTRNVQPLKKIRTWRFSSGERSFCTGYSSTSVEIVASVIGPQWH